ncbi:Eco57I restriction-modification methylase domain-containing protein [Methanoregula sp.]|uniref:Eco57I restriction-modification methylase domain-containing protein n=1 Tax=Methanoregula sp. TaxID=2052170 RepID=UPI003BAF5BB5
MRCPDPDPGKHRDRLSPPGAGTSLLHDLSAWREQLARSIARNNIGVRSAEIALAVHRTLFRFCILAIAEDRHLIIPGYLRQVLDAEDSDRRLAEFFADAGDLWAGPEEYPDIPARHKQSAGKRPAIDDPVIKTITVRLLSADRPYDFSLLSLEECAGVFDRYLARTIRRSAAHQAIIVDRPDAGIGHATPSPSLLDYAVEQTLAAALADRSPDEPLPLRILDPACGAGGLLIRAFHGLVPPLHGKQYTVAERTDLLQHTLHGLDPDPHAVAAARMLLAFAACEGEDARTLPGGFFIVFRDLNRILSGTVQCGNALVGPDIMDDESWAFCPGRERHAIQPFDWQEGFFEILAPGGFDAVISRPPDGPVPAREWWQQYVQRHYTVYDPGATRSAFFIEKSLALLRPRGVLGYITGDCWLHVKSGTPLRELLLGRQIDEIVIAGDGTCFLRLENAPPAHPFVARLAGPNPAAPGDCPGFPVDQQVLSAGGWRLRDTRMERVLEKISRAGTPLQDYILGEIRHGIAVEPESALVIGEHEQKELIRMDPRCKTLVLPYIAGEKIGRFWISSPQKFCIFIPQGWIDKHPAAAGHAWQWLKKRHPGITRHLKEHEALLKDQRSQGDYWWEVASDPDAWRGEKDRIIFTARVFPPRFTLGGNRTVFSREAGIIPSGSPYLLGLLNSRLAAFVLRKFGEETFTADDHRPGEIIGRFPVVTPDFDDRNDKARHDRMVALVTGMLDLHKHLSLAKTDQEKRLIQQEIDSTDKQIDSLVYGIYGLAVDEIAVVEEALTTIKSPP